MGRLLFTFALLLGLSALPQPSLSESLRVKDALTILSRVEPGRALIRRAKDRLSVEPSELHRIFRWGTVSRTDAVLTRHFQPATGQEKRERQVTIYLRENQPIEDLVLDIAHELTHATGGPEWDPYDPGLTAAQYIRAAIEGDGGEVEALVNECTVGLELARRYGVNVTRCDRYRDARRTGVVRGKIIQDFYRVGRWKRDLSQRLGHEARRFPLLSGDAPQLYSSTGRAPYPVALLREFESLSEVACANSRRRMATQAKGRSPAEEASFDASATEQFLQKRCR